MMSKHIEDFQESVSYTLDSINKAREKKRRLLVDIETKSHYPNPEDMIKSTEEQFIKERINLLLLFGCSSLVNGYSYPYRQRYPVVFISYVMNHHKQLAWLIKDKLLNEYGIETFVADRTLGDGDFTEKICFAMSYCSVFILLVDEKYLESDFCMLELMYAIKAQKNESERLLSIVPVWLRGDLPEEIKSINAVDCRDYKDNEDNKNIVEKICEFITRPDSNTERLLFSNQTQRELV